MRTMLEIDQELEQVSQQVARRKKLETSQSDIQNQIAQRNAAVSQAWEILRKEEMDVEELEGMSFTSFVARMKGDREERLNKERREAVAAKAAYDAAKADLEYLKRQLRSVQQELNGIADQEARYQELMDEKEQVLLHQGGAHVPRLMELSRQLENIDSMEQEVLEALHAGKDAMGALNDMSVQLKEAKDLGMWDMLGGGMFVTMMKHDKLDVARNCADEARWAMSEFRTELADVAATEVPDLEIGEFSTFADYFFDGIFADMFVQDKINTAQRETTSTIYYVEGMMSHLSDTLEDLTAQKTALEGERERLLAKI